MSQTLLEKPLEVPLDIEVSASQEGTFNSLIVRLSIENETPEGPMPMVLETHPGGRWFRDLGKGGGHTLGPGPSDQAASTAGNHRAALYVLPSLESYLVSPRIGRKPNASNV